MCYYEFLLDLDGDVYPELNAEIDKELLNIIKKYMDNLFNLKRGDI